MRLTVIFFSALLLMSCSEEKIVEYTFQKSMEHILIDLCQENKECIESVHDQVKGCMESSNWKDYLDEHEDNEKLSEFKDKFFACFVDNDGVSYFDAQQTE